jgi:hypothetical protein
VVARLSCLADDLPEIAELELNLVIAAEAGSRSRVPPRLLHPASRTDSARRSLLS